VYSAGYLDEDDIRMLHDEGVVGDVCTVFLRADGSYRDVHLNARATGPTPAELQRIPRRVCVVAGDNKAVPLLAALHADVVTDLVVDEVTATALLSIAGPAYDVAARGRQRGGALVGPSTAGAAVRPGPVGRDGAR
jgi:DNA-binding transcriptional regulator LsrR (DeoR family)